MAVPQSCIPALRTKGERVSHGLHSAALIAGSEALQLGHAAKAVASTQYAWGRLLNVPSRISPHAALHLAVSLRTRSLARRHGSNLPRLAAALARPGAGRLITC